MVTSDLLMVPHLWRDVLKSTTSNFLSFMLMHLFLTKSNLVVTAECGAQCVMLSFLTLTLKLCVVSWDIPFYMQSLIVLPFMDTAMEQFG